MLEALFFAVRTGLEPATPCVTGMYSNQAELPHQFFVSKFRSLFASAKVRLFLKLTNVLALFLNIFLKKTYIFVFFAIKVPILKYSNFRVTC